MRAVGNFPLLLALVAPAFAWGGQPADLTTDRMPVSTPGMATATMVQPVPLRPSRSRVTGSPAVSTPIGAREASAVDPATLCETAVAAAEQVNRLPPRLLGAIGRIETGRVATGSDRVRPWPWTINAAGEGRFFTTKQQAMAAVATLLNRGVRSIDVGCLQVNLMYHPKAFASLEEAFDPRLNANYASQFLKSLYAGSQSWPAAVAAYHSETPALGDAYRMRVMAKWQDGDLRPLLTRRATYGAFASNGSVYGETTSFNRSYGAFAPRSLVYGAFPGR